MDPTASRQQSTRPVLHHSPREAHSRTFRRAYPLPRRPGVPTGLCRPNLGPTGPACSTRRSWGRVAFKPTTTPTCRRTSAKTASTSTCGPRPDTIRRGTTRFRSCSTSMVRVHLGVLLGPRASPFIETRTRRSRLGHTLSTRHVDRSHSLTPGYGRLADVGLTLGQVGRFRKAAIRGRLTCTTARK